jgi:hypothetical protein
MIVRKRFLFVRIAHHLSRDFPMPNVTGFV